jgi:hypothetical protein
LYGIPTAANDTRCAYPQLACRCNTLPPHTSWGCHLRVAGKKLRNLLQGAKASFLQLLNFQLPPSVPRANVLLLGPLGAGESSLVSTLDSLLSGALTRRADYGDSTTSLTLALRHYTFTAGVGPECSSKVLQPYRHISGSNKPCNALDTCKDCGYCLLYLMLCRRRHTAAVGKELTLGPHHIYFRSAAQMAPCLK